MDNPLSADAILAEYERQHAEHLIAQVRALAEGCRELARQTRAHLATLEDGTADAHKVAGMLEAFEAAAAMIERSLEAANDQAAPIRLADIVAAQQAGLKSTRH